MFCISWVFFHDHEVEPGLKDSIFGIGSKISIFGNEMVHLVRYVLRFLGLLSWSWGRHQSRRW